VRKIVRYVGSRTRVRTVSRLKKKRKRKEKVKEKRMVRSKNVKRCAADPVMDVVLVGAILS